MDINSSCVFLRCNREKTIHIDSVYWVYISKCNIKKQMIYDDLVCSDEIIIQLNHYNYASYVLCLMQKIYWYSVQSLHYLFTFTDIIMFSWIRWASITMNWFKIYIWQLSRMNPASNAESQTYLELLHIIYVIEPQLIHSQN